MAVLADVVQGFRLKLRDFGRYFQCDVNGDGLATVFNLPVVMVERQGLSVQLQQQTITDLVLDTDYSLDDRNGQLRLAINAPKPADVLFVSGQHYTWFIDADIMSHAEWVIEELNDDPTAYTFSDISVNDPKFELTVRLTLVEGLWALLTEAALDIDVSSPEGMNIPASERYRQLTNLVAIWTERADELANSLNLGIERIEMFSLRRTSMTFGRYVPLYKAQEFDDQATPQRIYPPIDDDITPQ